MTQHQQFGPLSGVRVIELGTLIAGPFCVQLLGDLGADIIKVEDPAAGDPMRAWGPVKPGNRSLAWPIIARNKKCITCNLRTSAGQDLLRRLATSADVLVENFRPGTLERWGLGYEDLRTLNPRLVFVRVTGYGQTGPYASRAGFGSIGEAMGGLRYLMGEPDRPPSRAGVSLGDSLAGMFAALGAVSALYARDRTQHGQVVDSAIYEAVLALTESMLPEWQIAGYQRERTGAVLPKVAPSNAYPTADGAEILIAANLDTVFVRLAKVMGDPDLANDPRYATHGARGEHQQELDSRIARWTRGLDANTLLDRLHEAAVPAGRIYRASDMFADPHFRARQAIVSLPHPAFGEVPMQNVVPRLSETPGSVRWVGPELGQHNEEIYKGLLGMDSAEFDQLRANGTI